MTSPSLTYAGLLNTVRAFRTERVILVPRPVTSYSAGELWRICLENLCDAHGFAWPFRKVERTQPGVVMMRLGDTGLFAGPAEFKGFGKLLVLGVLATLAVL